MTNQPEYLLDGEPLLVCATNALWERLTKLRALNGNGFDGYDPELDAIMAELETRKDWPPYGGMCVP